MSNSLNNNNSTNPIRNLRQTASQGESNFSLEMFQNQAASYGFGGFENGNGMASYGNHQSTKEEPRDDSFLESFLC